MTDEQSQYHPINCEFHDLLEGLANSREAVQIIFRDEGGAAMHRDTVITEVFARSGVEYASLITGETLRLDWLVVVGGVCMADYAKTYAGESNVPKR